MTNDMKEVVIDADFFRKVTEKDKDGILFLKIMSELGRKPVMQEYVYDYELADSATVKKLVGDSSITIYSESDYITDDRSYRMWFEALYQAFNYKQFVGDVRQYHHEKENLGEIRSSLMAFYKGIDLFMSDDGEAKRYITNKLSSSRHKIDVYNVYDALERIGKMESRNLKWRNVKGMAKHVLDEQRYEKLNEIWHASD